MPIGAAGPGGKFIDIGALFDVHGGRYGPDCAILFGFSREEAARLRGGLLEIGCDESILPVYAPPPHARAHGLRARARR